MLGVFGLSIRTQERDLYEEFARIADTEKCVIVMDQRSGRSRGFGFVTMASVDDAQKAIDALNGIVRPLTLPSLSLSACDSI